jgi:hypothetical protein
MIKKENFFLAACLALAPLFFNLNAQADNLHVIDQDQNNGFAIYRSGRPNVSEIKELCRLGITEMMVLSGDADQVELKNQAICPTLKVIYNNKQDARVPLTESFLDQFDQWVEDARHSGKKIAFRCSCGCHRTGRLGAYYRMKYQNWTAEAAIKEMLALGKVMFVFPELSPQVHSLGDYVSGRACTVSSKFCVQLGVFARLNPIEQRD